MTRDSDKLKATKRLMSALVRMKPKPHEDMKLKDKKTAVPKSRRPPVRSKP